MTTQELHEKLRARFGDDVGPLSEPKIDAFCVVKPERIVEVCRFAKAEPGLELDYLEDLTAVDWPKRSAIELVYHLFSIRHRHGLVIKVELDRAAPRAPSVEGVWKAANWFEREVFDLFGVGFEGHPDLRRILMPDDWIGYPLRKDYQEAGGYHGIGNVRENPLVELRRLDERARASMSAHPERSDAEGGAESKGRTPPAPAAAPAPPTPEKA
jgi:NADH-quinone oxidoreductase subunit C